MLVELAFIILALVVLYFVASCKIIRQYERGVVFRFGRLLQSTRGPGLTMIIPGIDRIRKISLQIVTMPVPAQEGITRDNVTVRVDAVVYFKVQEPTRAVVNVEDYQFAMGQVAQTSLRSIIGKSDLDDLLSNRERLNEGLELMIDNPALQWGVHIDRVEIKDVSLPDPMKRSIARQAEAERERRSRIISADGEYQASRKLAQAAEVMSDAPSALQLRLLETVVEVAAEKNSTLVLPFPVELLRFVDSGARSGSKAGSDERTSTTSGATPAADHGSAAEADNEPSGDSDGSDESVTAVGSTRIPDTTAPASDLDRDAEGTSGTSESGSDVPRPRDASTDTEEAERALISHSGLA